MKKFFFTTALVLALVPLAAREMLANGKFLPGKDHRPAGWLVVSGEVVPEQKNFTLKIVKGPRISIRQTVSKLEPGKYLFSGLVRGRIHAVYVPLHVLDAGKKRIAVPSVWLGKKLLVPGKDGWMQFGGVLNVPKGAVSGFLYLEVYPVRPVKPGDTVTLGELSLTSQRE